MRLIMTVFIFTLATSLTALAKFDEKHRSINATADTLNSNEVEVGLGSLSYGATDELTFSVPTLPMALGVFSIGGKYKIPFSEASRLSPELGVGYYARSGSGISPMTVSPKLTLGFDWGEKRDYNVNFMVGGTYGPKYSIKLSTETSTAVGFTPTFGFEFDSYTTGGNIFFAGMATVVPYFGWTWAWENFHLGIVSSLVTLFIPIPYFYWRF